MINTLIPFPFEIDRWICSPVVSRELAKVRNIFMQMQILVSSREWRQPRKQKRTANCSSLLSFYFVIASLYIDFIYEQRIGSRFAKANVRTIQIGLT